jgi:hypothetical protein
VTDRLVSAALERIPPQLEAPSEAREPPETTEEQQGRGAPQSAAGEAQEAAEPRPWWRRMFGG